MPLLPVISRYKNRCVIVVNLALLLSEHYDSNPDGKIMWTNLPFESDSLLNLPQAGFLLTSWMYLCVKWDFSGPEINFNRIPFFIPPITYTKKKCLHRPCKVRCTELIAVGLCALIKLAELLASSADQRPNLFCHFTSLWSQVSVLQFSGNCRTLTWDHVWRTFVCSKYKF